MSNIYRAVCLAVLLLLTVLSSASNAENMVPIGSVEVPAGCALARKEHPRLLFTKADLPQIRARIANPGLKTIYEQLKKAVDEQMAQGLDRVQAVGAAKMLVPLGTLFHITGEEKYGQACRQITLKASFGCYATEGAYGYDLIYDLLSSKEREQCAPDIFLHVLWATDDSAKAMFPVEKIERAGQVGAKFTAEGLDVEVVFATTGDLACRTKLTTKGQIICDRPLANTIEDNYQKWRNDPRFDAWMANPHMRAVVGDKDQDLPKARPSQ
jgi:hypothetical protein